MSRLTGIEGDGSHMREVLNEIDLLEFIEDELSPAQAAAVREQLSLHPQVLARLEQMKQDRAILAAEPEPMLAADLVAELEPLLAKPMLLGASPLKQVRPGVYRARHRRSFARRWRPLAMAAGLIMTMGVAILWGINELGIFSTAGDGDRIAADDARARDEGSVGNEVDRLARGMDSDSGIVHHWLPGSGGDSAMMDDSLTSRDVEIVDDPAVRVTLRSGAEAIESPVALVVRGAVAEAVIERLATVIDEEALAARGQRSAESAGALVRNVTYAEVQAAWREMVASSGLPQQEQLIASMNGGSGSHAFTPQQRATVQRVARQSTIALGEHLAGDAALAATAEQQLRFGELGAAHSVTLRADEVVALLESLSAEFGEVIELERLDSDAAKDESSGDDALASWRRWREAIGVLQTIEAAAIDANVLLVLPVAFQED